MGDMSAIVTEFVEEGNERADQVERHLIQLEKNPGSRELLAEVFRAMHTIKGATSNLDGNRGDRSGRKQRLYGSDEHTHSAPEAFLALRVAGAASRGTSSFPREMRRLLAGQCVLRRKETACALSSLKIPRLFA